MTLLIHQDAIEKVMSFDLAISVIEETFRNAGEAQVENPPRMCMPIGDGFMRFGPAALHHRRVAGFKLWANFGSGPARGWNYLFDMDTGDLLAILHSYSLGRYRTSATTAVAAKYLARSDAQTVGLFGTGRLAGPQLKALKAVRPIKRVVAYSRNPASRLEFAGAMSKELGIEVLAAEKPEDAARDVDIILTITNTTTPVVKGSWLTAPCLVLGIGANQWYERELDEEVIKRAGLVVVDKKDQAKVEGGDLLWPIAHGLLTWDRVAELGDIIVGRVPLPDLRRTSVVFELHGLAICDVAISAAAYDLVKQEGLGREVNLTLGKARTEITTPGANAPARR